MKRIATLAETSETLTTVRIIYDSVPFAATPLPWLISFSLALEAPYRTKLQRSSEVYTETIARNFC
jgi:hypothetical protein